MRDKHDYMQKFGVETNADIARTLAMFGGFTEGLQLFASFAMLMNFPRHNKMKGMGQIVSWSVRDESLHCEGIIKLLPRLQQGDRRVTKAVADDIVDCCKTVVGLEDKFIDLAFEAGEVQGMTPDDIKHYIRFIADWRLRQLDLPEVYGVKENPLPWLQSMLTGVEHANFFEARATEYSKAATRGNWHEVWDGFDKRQKAKGGKAANEDAGCGRRRRGYVLAGWRGGGVMTNSPSPPCGREARGEGPETCQSSSVTMATASSTPTKATRIEPVHIHIFKDGADAKF